MSENNTSAVINHVPALALKRLSGHIGAEVSGVHLGSTLSSSQRDQLQAALLQHKVLFLRNQHLSDTEQQEFATTFGVIVPHPTQPGLHGGPILELDARGSGGRADSWHTDVTFDVAYPKVSILRAVTIPDYGGDTIWANTAAAYTQLPHALKQLVHDLWAVHTNDYDYAGLRPHATAEQLAYFKNVFAARRIVARHPLVRVHPETGERSLVIGHFAQRIEGLSSKESSVLLDLLLQRTIRPENTVRWRWQEGDVAIWDNRATLHYAVNDYGTQSRLVRRITIAGDVPVNIHGELSSDVSTLLEQAA